MSWTLKEMAGFVFWVALAFVVVKEFEGPRRLEYFLAPLVFVSGAATVWVALRNADEHRASRILRPVAVATGALLVVLSLLLGYTMTMKISSLMENF